MTLITTVGIDVGGARKGFHAVALTGGAYAGQLASCEVQELAQWCRFVVQARVIAIDAPCRWSAGGRARPCERQLRQQGIVCFALPTRVAAAAHPTNCFGWVLRGGQAQEAQKRSQRRELLQQAGIDLAPPTTPHPVVIACTTGSRRRAGSWCPASATPDGMAGRRSSRDLNSK